MSREYFEEILARISYQGWRFIVVEDYKARCYLQIAFNAVDNTTGQRAHWTSRKWVLSPHMTVSEVVQTAFKAVLTAVEHEARELFEYRGAAVFGPHFDVEKLVGLVKDQAYDKRT